MRPARTQAWRRLRLRRKSARRVKRMPDAIFRALDRGGYVPF